MPLAVSKLSVGPYNTNVYIVADDREAVIIDAADEPDRILAACAGSSLCPIPPSYIQATATRPRSEPNGHRFPPGRHAAGDEHT
jgi:hypothetical protein